MVSVTCGIVKEHYDKNMIKGGYHMVSKKMYELGTKKSTIRTIFEFGRKRAAEVGEENIYDFSLGNPNVPTPEFVKQAAIDILQTMPPEAVHGYTIAPGNPQVRETLARSINGRFGTHFAGKNLFMTAGAAAAITICFKALCEEGDEFITFAPFFPEYRCFVESVGGKLVVVPARVEDFQIDFAAFEALLTPPAHLRGDIAGIMQPLDSLNTGILRSALSKLTLRQGVDIEQAMQYFSMLQTMFNGYYGSPSMQTRSLEERIREHEKAMPAVIDFMLYGIAQKEEG